MHIRFEDVQAVDDKVIFQTSKKCCNKRDEDEVELWFFHTALGIIETNMPSFKSFIHSILRTILKN